MQKVLVAQRDGLGAGKIAEVRKLSDDVELRVIDVNGPFLPIVDYPENHFPPDLADSLEWADIVVDHLYHADLTGYLLEQARAAGKPLIASGRKVPGAVCPTTCCTLGRMDKLGRYGAEFGYPAVDVELDGEGRIAHVEVRRGAPCGATWAAAAELVGLTPEEAKAKFGLATQFNCLAKANPNVFLKNPLHVAGEVHSAALARALGEQVGDEEVNKE